MSSIPIVPLFVCLQVCNTFKIKQQGINEVVKKLRQLNSYKTGLSHKRIR